ALGLRALWTLRIPYAALYSQVAACRQGCIAVEEVGVFGKFALERRPEHNATGVDCRRERSRGKLAIRCAVAIAAAGVVGQGGQEKKLRAIDLCPIQVAPGDAVDRDSRCTCSGRSQWDCAQVNLLVPACGAD